MRRRTFISFLAATVAQPSFAVAQQSRAQKKVGVLIPGLLGAERERLINEGLTSEPGGENAVLVVRSAEGDEQRLVSFANELAGSVDVILAVGPASLSAALQASRTVPIAVIDLESDPIANGFAQSLSRPGGNVTGIFLDAPEIAGKWIQIIRELLPATRKVALLYDSHLGQAQVKSGEDAARSVSIETLRLGIEKPEDLRGALQHAADGKVTAVLVHSSPNFVDQAPAIIELCREFLMPSIGLFPIYARLGGLISYGPNNYELIKQVGAIAGKILGGAKTAEFPIQRPIYHSFLINMRTARLLQLTIPSSLLALADEVIE